MAITIRIDDVDIDRIKGSVNVFDTLSRRSTADFNVYDADGSANHLKGQEVDIFTGFAVPPFLHPLFNGYIDTPERKRTAPESEVLVWDMSCKDNHYLADKRVAAKSYITKTAAFIVNDLITSYLAAEGVTAGTIDTGVTFDEVVIPYRPISEVLNTLAKRCGFIWFIDKFKVLYFMARTTASAPFDVDSGDIIRSRFDMPAKLANSAPKYRNRQYIPGGQDVTTVQVETFTGDGVTVAFAVGYDLASVPTITEDLGAMAVGIKGIDDATYDYYWSKGDPIVVARVAPAGAVAVVVTYYGLYNFIVQADDPAEQAARAAIEGTTGIVEVVDNEPGITRKDDALAVAVANLNMWGMVGKQFTFPIRDWGLEPGQILTVDYPEYDLNSAELLIESVDVSEIAPNNLMYRIKAIEGAETGDWTAFFGALASVKGDVMERLTIGGDELLILLTKTSETWEWSESITENVYACTVCNGTVCGGATPVVC